MGFLLNPYRFGKVWTLVTSTLANIIKTGSSSALPSVIVATQTFILSSVVKVSKISAYIQVIRTDISGHQAGKVVVTGYDLNDTAYLIMEVTHTNSTVVYSNILQPNIEFAKIKYDCYMTDTISRNHTYSFNCKVTEWYE